jgi:dTMP kinase
MGNQQGLFIVFDGPEGAGKSTQIELLRGRFRREGHEVVQVRDPGATRIGERIRAILLDPAHVEMGMRCEMLLYMAARAQLLSQLILPALSEGKTVLCDRFVSSTLAYQMGGDDLTADDIHAAADIAIRRRWPDLVLLLDMPVGRSLGRVKRAKDRIEQRPLSYHEQVRRSYLAQAAADPAHYRLIDADRDRDAVAADIWLAVQDLLVSSDQKQAP